MSFFKSEGAEAPGKPGRTTVLVVAGMQSSECVRRIESALRAVPGVSLAGVNLLTRLSTVQHCESTTPAMLTQAVCDSGFHAAAAHAPHCHESSARKCEPVAGLKARFIMGAALTVLLCAINTLGPENSKKLFLLCLLATPMQIAVGWDIYAAFFRALRRLRFNLDSLAALASSAAYAQGMLCFLGQVSHDPDLLQWHPQFHSGALVLTAVTLGHWLVALARDSAEDVWGGFEALLPSEACVLRGTQAHIIPANAVALGDVVLVSPGERIPVDGEVLDGFSHIDESPLTGDGRPVSKMAGDRVAAAAMNGSGVLRIRAMGCGPQSTFAHISMLVGRARSRQSRSEMMADAIAGWLAPAAIFLAAAIFALWRCGPPLTAWLCAHCWLDVQKIADLTGGSLGFLTRQASYSEALRPAISVLLAACPCALALAAPAAVLAATRRSARRGIFFKGGDALEAAGRITDVIFDQSGTLTCGTYRVREVFAVEGGNKNDVLALAAALGTKTKLESARSIEREARKQGLAVPLAERCELLAGGGISAHFGAQEFWLCPRAYLRGGRAQVDPQLEACAAVAERDGFAVLYLCRAGGAALGAVSLEDRIKQSAPLAVDALRQLGLRVHLLSGEALAQARMVGRHCGLLENEIHINAGSAGKESFTRELQAAGRRVAVVGDGASDAPALAAADVGIALSAGVDAATDAAGILLASGDVLGAARAIEAGRAAARVIQQNLVAALASTAVLLPLALLNKVVPSTGALLLICGTLAIVLNSLRLLKQRSAFDTSEHVMGSVSGARQALNAQSRLTSSAG